MRRCPRSSRLRRRALLGLAGTLAVAASLIDVEPARVLRPTRSGGRRAPIAEPAAPANDAGVPALFAEHAQDSIAMQEYQASRNDRGLQAPNRAHNLRTYFEPWGIRVEDRTAEVSRELFRMKTTMIGRNGRRDALAAGELRQDGARVENRRRGGIVEWYENSDAGLEHGYVIDRRPAGDGALRIDVAFEGARVSLTDGRALIDAPTGRRLEYGKLLVEDATGRGVPAHMELSGANTVRLVVDDDGAAYPVLIDPLLTSTADATLQSDQVEAHLGYSVASAGDVNGDGYADVIVGADTFDSGQTEEGAAFVFHGGPAGIASGGPTTANATLQSDQMDAFLGSSVDGAGDVNGDGYADVIVGARQYGSGETNEGAAFVFHGGPTGVASGNPSTANATLQSNQDFAALGLSVSGAGDVNGDGYADVIVGAPYYDSGENNEGAVFVFHGSATGVASGNPATANSVLQSDLDSPAFGIGVSGAGDVNGDGFADVIIGAYLHDSGQADEGAAFVFHGGPTGVASGNLATAAATLESNQADAQLGSSVAGAGDVNGDGYADVIVGAPNYDSGQADEGAAFVFHGSAAGVASGNPSTAGASFQSDQASALLGNSVAGAGDVNGDGYADVIVGASLFDSGQDNEGAAFVFTGGPAGVTSGNPSTAVSTLQSDQVNANTGWSVASAGDVNGDGYADVIVGAFLYDSGQANEGAAFVYIGGAEGVRSGNPASAHSTLQSDQASAQLGYSVAGAGDVNGDGYSDVIIGVRLYDAGEMDEGAVFLFHGAPTGIPSGNPMTANSTLQSDQAGADFGIHVAGAGDVNGDGYADVIVAARGFDAGQMDEGAAFVFHGGPSGIPSGNPSTANATIQFDQADVGLDVSVAGAGDVNGDGFADVVVGVYFYDAGQHAEGAAFVYHGGPSGIAGGNPSTANATLQSDQDSAGLGSSVAGAGDVNGDGYADVIVGALSYGDGQMNEGAAFIFHGGPMGVVSGNPSTANTTLQSNLDFASFGCSVASAGDVNGDGFSDVIVGATSYAAPEPDEGGAFVFHGSSSGVADGNPTTANATLQSDQMSAQLGRSVSGAGDVNGDGYADVIVGAWLYNATFSDEGAVFVFRGGPSGITGGNPTNASTTLFSVQSSGHLGNDVAGAGDVNGDGYADVIVGAPNYDSGQMNEGAAFVFLGNGDGLGRSVRSRQLRGNADTTSVEPWGSSEAGDFQVRMTATHPDGRGRVKLQVEACPAGENWGGAGTVTVTSSTWTDVTATSGGVTLTQAIPGLDPFTLYRWRARALHAPFTFTIAAPNPAHGPWRRLRGQAVEADIRTEGCTITCPGNVTTGNDDGMCGAVVNYSPMTTGMCGTVTCLPPAGSFFAIGTTAVNCSTTSGPSCSFFVTVNDTQAPVANCPSPITVGTDPGLCSAVVNFSATASDNCPGASIACIPTSGSTFAVGTTMVTCTATDAVSNTGTCTFNVTVNDTQAPSLACPTNIQTIALTPSGRVVSYTVPTATDNCGAVVMCAPAPGSTFAIGTTTVTCTATDAATNSTPCQFTVDVAPLGTDTAGIYVPATGSWFLRNDNSPGPADIVFGYGPAGIGWLPLEGDWDGNGSDTAGLYDPVNGNFFLKNTNAPGGADLTYGFGLAGLGWIPLVGDWNGDGVDTVGLYDPVNGNFFLRDTHSPGAADLVYGFGPAGLSWIPLVGDWDGNASDTIGLYDPVNGNFFLRNAHAAGGADLVYGFGPAGLGWKPLAGDWNGDGSDTIGLYDPANGNYFLRNAHSPGPADVVFGYGPAGSTPILGDWNGL